MCMKVCYGNAATAATDARKLRGKAKMAKERPQGYRGIEMMEG